MRISLEGRSALVTGASLGLGRAMALTFAEAGADVALVARRADVLARTRDEIAERSGRHVVALTADVGNAEEIGGLWRKAEASLGKIDILVNNAGRSAAAPFESVDDAAWQADLDLKLFAAIRLARLALPGMKERRWGRIINVLNIAAKAPGSATAPTSISRAAGLALTKLLANEMAPHNILVNALLVGQIDSDQWARRHAAADDGRTYEEFLAEKGQAVPLGRLGKAEEFAAMACLLASDMGGFVTGTAINVDGGRSPVV